VDVGYDDASVFTQKGTVDEIFLSRHENSPFSISLYLLEDYLFAGIYQSGTSLRKVKARRA
jgi:hypothetical protein